MIHPTDDTLRKYVGRQLSQRDGRALEEHLTGCARCREEVAIYRAIDGLVLSAPVPTWQPGPLLADVARRIRQPEGRQRFGAARWRVAGMAAALALAVGAALYAESVHFWYRVEAENIALYAEHYSFTAEPNVQPVALVVKR